jgi:hypothetical protein
MLPQHLARVFPGANSNCPHWYPTMLLIEHIILLWRRKDHYIIIQDVLSRLRERELTSLSLFL